MALNVKNNNSVTLHGSLPAQIVCQSNNTCMKTHLSKRTHVYTHTCMYAHTHTHMHAHTYIHTHACTLKEQNVGNSLSLLTQKRTNLGKIPFPYVHEKNKLGEIPFPFKQRHQLLHQQHKLERSSPRGKASLATEQTPQEQLAGQD